MKKLTQLFLAVVMLSSINGFSQTLTLNKKSTLSFGIGKQSYNGNLGNAWFKMDEEWYVFGSLKYSRLLNKSFDASLSVTHGDYGHCREAEEPQFRPDGTEVLNLLSRLTAAVVTVKYKFANGYLLKENAKFSPFVYAGAGFNNVSNFLWSDKTRVNPGNFSSINGGIGLQYNFYKNFNFSYDLGIGAFTSDDIDFRKSHDKYLQSNFMFGMSF